MLRDDDLKFDLLDFNNNIFDPRCFIAAKSPRKMVALLSSFVVVCNDSSAFFSLPVVCNR